MVVLVEQRLGFVHAARGRCVERLNEAVCRVDELKVNGFLDAPRADELSSD